MEVAVESGMHGTRRWAMAASASASAEDWRVVDRALRLITQRRAALDAEEARWLREAEALQIWRPLGMVSVLDYMERVLGYAPRTAQDRLRVARALGELPALTAALAEGELAFTAVRELTRVATPGTEAAWVAAAQGKNLRQIEELVADHRLGDHPDDPKDPTARTHVVRFELLAETFALFRQVRQVLDDEHGASLADDQLIAKLCAAVLDGAATGEPGSRAKFQVAVTVCERCAQGWQHGAGAKIAINAGAVERAMCDAQHIGSIDGAGPARAHQDVSPSVARFVWHRDGGRCRVPGCRSSRGLEIHHLVRRVDGGGHDASNLVLACSSCHQAHHAGTLTITGTAEHLEIRRSTHPAGATMNARNEPAQRCSDGTAPTEVANPGAHVGAAIEAERGCRDAFGAERDCRAAFGAERDCRDASAKLQAAEVHAEAKAALRQLGWKPAVARAAVAAATSVVGANVTLERMIVEALRHCPRRAVRD